MAVTLKKGANLNDRILRIRFGMHFMCNSN